MNSSHICQYLYKEIQEHYVKGKVHSVFENSFNVLDGDNRLISFLSSNKPMAPHSIKLKDQISFIDVGLERGQELEFHQDYVLIKDLNKKINYGKAFPWDKKPILFTNEKLRKDLTENVSIKIKKIGEFLLNEGSKEGIYPLLQVLRGKIKGIDTILADNITLGRNEEFIKERFLDFMDSYIKGDIDNISSRTQRIVGFGVGLTPSMDDFISGMMVSRIYLYSYFNQQTEKALKLNKAIVKHIKNKTTLVSEEMLMFASLGEVNEDVRNLMLSLLTNSPIDELYNNLRKVASFGATSGTDIISGIYVGSCIIFNLIQQEVDSNE